MSGCNDNCTDFSRGKKGDPGVSSFEYIAYASDDIGTGFSLIPSSSLPFMSSVIKQVPAGTLTLADFPLPFLRYLGADGLSSQWFTGSGVPAGGTGVINDMYLDTATGNVYQKTGVSTWTLNCNINGADGTDARLTLFNDLSQTDSGNTGNVMTLLVNHSIAANTFLADGDRAYVQIVSQCMMTDFSNIPIAQIHVNGGAINQNVFSNNMLINQALHVGGGAINQNVFSNNLETAVYDIIIDRISSSSFLCTIKNSSLSGLFSSYTFIVTGFNFVTTAIPIEIWAKTVTPGTTGIICRGFFGEYKPI